MNSKEKPLNNSSLNEQQPALPTNGDVAPCMDLVCRVADVATSRIRGITPLHLAVMEGHIELVKAFLTNESDLMQPDDMGWLPIHYAALGGGVTISQLILLQQICLSILKDSTDAIGVDEIIGDKDYAEKYPKCAAAIKSSINLKKIQELQKRNCLSDQQTAASSV